MGTFVTIKADEKDKKVFEDAFSIFQTVENALSSYNSNSPIFRLNKDQKAIIFKETYEALELSKRYYKETEGYFNIAIGSISKDLYRFGETQRVPSPYELEHSVVDFKGLHYNKVSAYIENKIKIDLGGMGKGFGVDKVAAMLRNNNIDATIAASGDIRCLGICRIEIKDPLQDGSFVAFKTKLEDIGVSTSGNYNRFVETPKHNHLINPKTKQSQQNFISITLIGSIPNADLDAYATAVSVMPKQKAYAFLATRKIAYIIIESDFSIVYSPNLQEFVVLESFIKELKSR